MLLTTHALFGIAIGEILPEPLVAPAAFGSHFAADMLPHFDHPGIYRQSSGLFGRSPMFWLVRVGDLLLAVAITAIAALVWPERAVGIVAGVFCAILPDLLFITRVVRGRDLWPPFDRFHRAIQWFERPVGIVTELALAIPVAALVFTGALLPG